MVTGTELIRRKTGGEAFAFTCPLIKKADGGKFGKTEKGNVWLDPEKTSPYQFYQFWLNANDSDAEDWIKIFTFLDQARQPRKFDAREWLKPAGEAAKQICKQRYIQFGCEGQAGKIKAHSLQVVAGQYAKGELSQVVR